MTGCLLVHSSHKPWNNWGAQCVALFPGNLILMPGRYVGDESVVDDGEPLL